MTVLYFVLFVSGVYGNNSNGAVAMTSGTQEHSSQATCEQAKTMMRESLAQNVRVVTLYCAPR